MEKMDRLNKLFTSSNLSDILNFYDNFDTRKQLIKWSRNRRHGRVKIFSVGGKNDIVVVIPTIDHNGENAKQCKVAFKGQRIIFIESGRDPYFNYAHNCNAGIKYAMKFKPSWIVVSNDDVTPDSMEKLRSELSGINSKKFKRVVSDGFSVKEYLYRETVILSLIRNIGMHLHRKNYGYSKEDFSKFQKKYRALVKKYDLRYGTIKDSPSRWLLYRRIRPFTLNNHFHIFSTESIRKHGLPFDETFINGFEDSDLGLFIKPKETAKINFKVVPFKGGSRSLGRGLDRMFRDLINKVYLNESYETGKYN